MIAERALSDPNIPFRIMLKKVADCMNEKDTEAMAFINGLPSAETKQTALQVLRELEMKGTFTQENLEPLIQQLTEISRVDVIYSCNLKDYNYSGRSLSGASLVSVPSDPNFGNGQNQTGPDTTSIITSPSHSNLVSPLFNQYSSVSLSSCPDVISGQIYTDEHMGVFNYGDETSRHLNMFSTAASLNTGISNYHVPQGHYTKYDPSLFNTEKHVGEVLTYLPPDDSSLSEGVIVPTSTGTGFPLGSMSNTSAPTTFDSSTATSNPAAFYTQDSPNHPGLVAESYLMSEASTQYQAVNYSVLRHDSSSPVANESLTSNSMNYDSQNIPGNANLGSEVLGHIESNDTMRCYPQPYHPYEGSGEFLSAQLENNRPVYPIATAEPNTLIQTRNTTNLPMCSTVSASTSLTSYPYLTNISNTGSSIVSKESSLCPDSLVQSLSAEQKHTLFKLLQSDPDLQDVPGTCPDLQDVQGTKGNTHSLETATVTTQANTLQAFFESELNTTPIGNSTAIVSSDCNAENHSSSTFVSQADIEDQPPPQDVLIRTPTQSTGQCTSDETTPSLPLDQRQDDGDITPQLSHDASKVKSNPVLPGFYRTSDEYITSSKMPRYQKKHRSASGSVTTENSSPPPSGRVSQSPVQSGERSPYFPHGHSEAENFSSNRVTNVDNTVSSVSQSNRNYLHSVSEDTKSSVLSSITSTSSLSEDQTILSSISSRRSSSGIGSLTYSIPLRERSTSAVVNDEALSELLASGMKVEGVEDTNYQSSSPRTLSKTASHDSEEQATSSDPSLDFVLVEPNSLECSLNSQTESTTSLTGAQTFFDDEKVVRDYPPMKLNREELDSVISKKEHKCFSKDIKVRVGKTKNKLLSSGLKLTFKLWPYGLDRDETSCMTMQVLVNMDKQYYQLAQTAKLHLQLKTHTPRDSFLCTKEVATQLENFKIYDFVPHEMITHCSEKCVIVDIRAYLTYDLHDEVARTDLDTLMNQDIDFPEGDF